MPYSTIGIHQYLSFKFGRASQSLAQELDAGLFGPAEAQLKMEIGKYANSEKNYIHLKQNKIDVMARRHDFSDSKGRGDDFTPQGNAMMQDLLAQKDIMLSLPGMSDTDRELLSKTLGIVKKQYDDKEISLIPWFS